MNALSRVYRSLAILPLEALDEFLRELDVVPRPVAAGGVGHDVPHGLGALGDPHVLPDPSPQDSVSVGSPKRLVHGHVQVLAAVVAVNHYPGYPQPRVQVLGYLGAADP